MRNFIWGLCCLAVLAAPGAFAGGEEAEEARAREAIAEFGDALKSELTAAMQAGGPLQAIAVCNDRAPAIAEAVSLKRGMSLSRVSLRYRNPDNAANAWQATVLRDFEQRLALGEPADLLTWQEIAGDAGQREFRFMKAIPTGAICLTCHGESIAQPVAEKIAEFYPDDRATGFREGELRGAFVVTRQMSP